MFHLLQPIWMLTAMGIIIPIVIHLWNIKQGKILKVGSIAFLTQSSKNYATNLKLTDLLLLIIRCILIILLALLIAQPRLDQSFQSAKVKGWVLLEKENIAIAYNRFKPLIDSLMQAGYEFHYFNAGFKKEQLQDALKDQNEPIVNIPLSYRTLLKQLDRLVPAELPVYLFTNNYLTRQGGSREAVSINLHWHTYTPADSLASFISKAYSISTDSIRIILGTSQPRGTVYTYKDIDIKKNTNPDLLIGGNNGRLLVSYQKDEPIAVDTSALSITIFTDKYFTDAAYIKAAAEAVRQFSKHIIRLYAVSNLKEIPLTQDWLFWLSELPLPAAIKASNIFKYAEGDVKNTGSWINTETGINGDEEKIALFKLIGSKQETDSSQKIWQDGFGNTVLSLERTKINRYRLFTHLDPSWNDLPWSNKFPQFIYTLLYPADKTGLPGVPDKRIISELQLLPATNTNNVNSLKQKFITTDISPFFWLGVFILFFIERFIALRTRKEVVYG